MTLTAPDIESLSTWKRRTWLFGSACVGPGTSELLACGVLDEGTWLAVEPAFSVSTISTGFELLSIVGVAGTGLAVGLGFCVVTSATGFELLSAFIVATPENMGRTTKIITAARIAMITIPTIITLFLDGGAFRSGTSGAGETAGFGGLVATRSGDAGIVSDFRVIIVEPVGVPQISQNFASFWSIAPQIWQTGGGSIFAPQISQNLLSKESGWLQSGQ